MTSYKRVQISKISMPVLPDIILRHHLFEIIEDRRHYRLTWISAPAGSGKTTLVAGYVNHRSCPYIWYRFDNSDDESTFFYYLRMAATVSYPTLEGELPEFGPQFKTHRSNDPHVFSRCFFEKLSGELIPPLMIIFDDYHKIDKDSGLHGIIKSGMNGASHGIHFIVMSRVKPHTAYISGIANNQMRVITENKLMLNKQESTRIFEKEINGTISDAVAEQIFRKTSGWISGIILLAQDFKEERLQKCDIPHHISDYIDEYFSSELFNHFDPQLQLFLIKASILPEIIPGVIKDLTGIHDPAHLLEKMQSNNFFIQKISGTDHSYQFHPLFKAYLQKRLDNVLSSREQLELRMKAARSLEKHEKYTQALNLLVQTGDTENLIRILHEKAHLLHLFEMYEPLVEWIAHIPESTLKKDPWLLHWLGYSYCYLNTEKSIHYLDSAFRIFEKAQDLNGFINSWIAITGSIYHARNNYSLLDNQIVIYEKHIKYLEKDQQYEIQTGILVNIIKAWLSRCPNHPQLLNKVKEAIDIYRSNEEKEYSNQVIMMVIDYCYFTGNYFDKVFLDSEIDKVTNMYDLDPFENLFIRTFQIKSYFWTEQPATELLNVSIDSIKKADETNIHSYTQIFFSGAIYALMVLTDFDRAEKYLLDFGKSLSYHHYKSYMLYYYFSSMWHLNQQNIALSVYYAEKALYAAEKVGQRFWEILCRFGYAQILCAQKKFNSALKENKSAYDMATRYSSTILQYMCGLGRAHIHLKRNKRKEADNQLKTSLTLGSDYGYLKLLWWHEPQFLATLCDRALRKGYNNKFVLKTIRFNQLNPPPSPEKNARWPWPVKISTLGKFTIFTDDKKVEFKRKSQKKPMELLKIIIANFGIVSAESVMDLLWRDTDGDLAVISLNTTINRLRNILKYRDAIIFSDGRISLNNDLCFIDMIEFYHLSRQIKKRKKTNIALIKRAVDNYKNHFLAFEKEKPWIKIPQQKLREYFFDFILDLASYHENRKKFQHAIRICRHGLDIIPAEEVFYLKIMECYLKLNKPGMVKKTYYDCLKALKLKNQKPSREAQKLIDSADHIC